MVSIWMQFHFYKISIVVVLYVLIPIQLMFRMFFFFMAYISGMPSVPGWLLIGSLELYYVEWIWQTH